MLLVGFPLLVHFLIGQTLAWGWGREGQDLGLKFCCCLNFISWNIICQGRREQELWERNKKRRTKQIFCSSWEKLLEEQLEDATPKYCGFDNSGVGGKFFSYYEYCQQVAFCNFFLKATNPAINTFHPWYPDSSNYFRTKNEKRRHLVFPVVFWNFDKFSNIFPRNILLLQNGHNYSTFFAEKLHCTNWHLKNEQKFRWPFLPEAFTLDPGVGDEKKGRKLLLPPPFTLSKRRRQRRMRNKEQTLFKDLRRGLVLK